MPVLALLDLYLVPADDGAFVAATAAVVAVAVASVDAVSLVPPRAPSEPSCSRPTIVVHYC